MTIKEKLAAKTAELEGLKAAIENNDADAIVDESIARFGDRLDQVGAIELGFLLHLRGNGAFLHIPDQGVPYREIDQSGDRFFRFL